MNAEHWVLAYECDIRGCRVTAAEQARLGRPLDVGREGELPIAVTVPNTAVSRRAVVVTPTEHGWQIEVLNRNGAVLHPWGQAPELAGAHETVHWPLVGLRLLPDVTASQHWVLLEASQISVTPSGATDFRGVRTRTQQAQRPGELPPGEREALQTVFAELLAWPPRQGAEPLLLKQAASRIGISVSGVQDRLKAARARALRLGLHREVALTDPSYLYVLVRGGYLDPPGGHRSRSGPR
jgi:hypothetical protein